MSDLASEIHTLSQTIRELSLSVDLLSFRVAQIQSQLHTTDTWEIVEPTLEFAGGLTSRQIVLEEGPPELPAELSVLAGVLSEIGGGRQQRAKEAFECGYWAQIALETHTEYRSKTYQDLQFSHWICLRGAGVSSPYRVTRKSDLNRLLSQARPAGPTGLPEKGPIVQGFASLAELRIFCGGAGIPIPPLLRWRSA